MTTRLTMTTWASATTPRCLKTMRRAFHRVRKCLTTYHSLIKARHGMGWMTLVSTQMETQIKPPTPRMYEARRSRTLFELLLVQYFAYITCILSTTCSFCSMRTHCSSTDYSAGSINTVLCPLLYWSRPLVGNIRIGCPYQAQTRPDPILVASITSRRTARIQAAIDSKKARQGT